MLTLKRSYLWQEVRKAAALKNIKILKNICAWIDILTLNSDVLVSFGSFLKISLFHQFGKINQVNLSEESQLFFFRSISLMCQVLKLFSNPVKERPAVFQRRGGCLSHCIKVWKSRAEKSNRKSASHLQENLLQLLSKNAKIKPYEDECRSYEI